MTSDDPRRRLTILVPALNEETKIGQTLAELLPVVRATLDDYELFLIDDGSSDQTGSIMEKFAASDPRLHVVHNSYPHGLSWMFREYIAQSRFDYLAMVVGDGANSNDALKHSFEAIGSADLIVGYRTNRKRPFLRETISFGFWLIMSILYGLRIKDWTGYFIWPVNLIRALGPLPLGNTYSVEVLVRLLRNNPGIRIANIPMPQNPEGPGSSKMVSWSTVRDVVRTICRLTCVRS